MNNEQYMVTFAGDILEGQSISYVKKQLSILYGVDIEEINEIFATLPKTVKKNIDYHTAVRFRDGWQRAGAQCRIYPMRDSNSEIINQQDNVSQTVNPQANKKLYAIVFSGKIRPGQDVRKVKENLALLFKVDIIRIEKMLRHLPKVIKKNLDYSSAIQYKNNWEKTGALCQIVPIKLKKIISPIAPLEKLSPIVTKRSERFMVVFAGKLAQDHDLNSVKNHLASFYKVEAVAVEKIFSRLPKVVKKNVPLDVAKNYQKNWEKAGGICQILQMTSPQKRTANITSKEKPFISRGLKGKYRQLLHHFHRVTPDKKDNAPLLKEAPPFLDGLRKEQLLPLLKGFKHFSRIDTFPLSNKKENFDISDIEKSPKERYSCLLHGFKGTTERWHIQDELLGQEAIFDINEIQFSDGDLPDEILEKSSCLRWPPWIILPKVNFGEFFRSVLLPVKNRGIEIAARLSFGLKDNRSLLKNLASIVLLLIFAPVIFFSVKFFLDKFDFLHKLKRLEKPVIAKIEHRADSGIPESLLLEKEKTQPVEKISKTNSIEVSSQKTEQHNSRDEKSKEDANIEKKLAVTADAKLIPQKEKVVREKTKVLPKDTTSKKKEKLQIMTEAQTLTKIENVPSKKTKNIKSVLGEWESSASGLNVFSLEIVTAGDNICRMITTPSNIVFAGEYQLKGDYLIMMKSNTYSHKNKGFIWKIHEDFIQLTNTKYKGEIIKRYKK